MRDLILKRSKQIGIQVIWLTNRLPVNRVNEIIFRQILRSATSVGANYRAAFRAKSKADFIYKLKIVEEEADETLYWLEVMEETLIVSERDVELLKKEVNEILSIVVKSIQTARSNNGV